VNSPLPAWTARRTGLGDGLSAETLAAWQLEQVRRTVGYARERGGFYGERLRGVTGPGSMAEWVRLPFTWPAELAREPLAFLCVPRSQVARVTTLETSGSTGAKKRVCFTAEDLERTVDFFAHGMGTLVRRGQRALILMPAASEHSIGRLLRQGLERIGVEGHIPEPGWGAREALAAAAGAHCLVGLPAELLYLSRADPGLRPESVLLSADYVPESVIAALTAAWGCRVFSHYGMTETGFGCAVQCGAGSGHHLRDPDLLLEIVDPGSGAPVPSGTPGEIVLTTLRNQAMPLIRYRTGDLGRMLTGACACGCQLPRLGRVEGRMENRLVLAGGIRLSIHELDELLFAQPAVRGFSAELDEGEGGPTLRLTVEADGVLDRNALAARLPHGLAVAVRYGGADPFVHRGKRRVVRCGNSSQGALDKSRKVI
jgi:phenylacetate-coenzyme A ligase PaaK-like adenylate-forming protein